MASEPRDFRFECDPELPRILRRLDRCLVLSTYRSGRLLILGAGEEEGDLAQRGVDLPRPMGIAVADGRLAVATSKDLIVLEEPDRGADGDRRSPPTGAGLEIRSRWPTGAVDMHDIAWDGADLWGVNTRYSCLNRVRDGEVEVGWQPSFVSDLVPEDRCHLNGLAVEDGEPTWVTALGSTDEAGAWRGDRLAGGVLIHVPSGETVLEGLAMPHSPRVWDRSVYFLIAARGEVCRADTERRTWEVVARVPGFARGLARGGDYLFVGHSLVRRHHLFGDLPVAAAEQQAGVSVIDLGRGEIVAGLRYLTDCEEIYDVQLAEVQPRGPLTAPGRRPPAGSDDRPSGAADGQP